MTQIGGYENHRMPSGYNRAGCGTQDNLIGLNPGIDLQSAIEGVIVTMEKYERSLTRRKERCPTEFDLVVLGINLMEYIPQEMGRYEKVLDQFGERGVKVDWVRNILFGGLETSTIGDDSSRLGIGAVTTVLSLPQNRP